MDIRQNEPVRPHLLVAAAVGLSMATLPAAAQDVVLPAGLHTEVIEEAAEAVDGSRIAYPEGEAEVTAAIGTIGSGGRTALYRHLVPAFAYVLEGEVELRIAEGEPRMIGTGGSYVGSGGVDHQLFNAADSPARVLFVFAGTTGGQLFETAGPVPSAD